MSHYSLGYPLGLSAKTLSGRPDRNPEFKVEVKHPRLKPVFAVRRPAQQPGRHDTSSVDHIQLEARMGSRFAKETSIFIPDSSQP